MPTRKTPAAATPSESSRDALQDRSTGRDVMLRSLPDDAYAILRRLAYERNSTYGEVLAGLLRDEANR